MLYSHRYLDEHIFSHWCYLPSKGYPSHPDAGLSRPFWWRWFQRLQCWEQLTDPAEGQHRCSATGWHRRYGVHIYILHLYTIDILHMYITHTIYIIIRSISIQYIYNICIYIIYTYVLYTVYLYAYTHTSIDMSPAHSPEELYHGNLKTCGGGQQSH